MAFELPKLPFDEHALDGWTSAETLSFHHGKHHAGYVTKLNAALGNSPLAEQSLEEVIGATRNTDLGIFNNAAQHWNHSFFWECLTGDSLQPEGQIAELIMRDYGSFATFKEEFGGRALKLFGSGWTWLLLDPEGKLKIEHYKDADTPYASEFVPLLTLDVWEHAYYIDFRNDRAKFIDGFWSHVHWPNVDTRLR